MCSETSASNPPETSPEEESFLDRSLLPESFATADIMQQMLLILGCSAYESLAPEQVWSWLDAATRVDYERGKTSRGHNNPRDFAFIRLAEKGDIIFVKTIDPKSDERIRLTEQGREKFLKLVEKPHYGDED